MIPLWLYWENAPGAEPPPHVLLCHRILRRVCRRCDIRLVTPETVRRWLPDYDPRLDRIRVVDRPGTEIAVRCDFIRAFLLERHGGLYVDADCIALRDFAEIGERLAEVEFVGMRRTSARDGRVSIGLYGSAVGGRIISAYAEALRRLIASKQELRYIEAGQMLLTPVVGRHLDTAHLYPEHLIQPVTAPRQGEFLRADLEPEAVIAPEAFCFMLFHRSFEEDLGDWGLRELYYGDILLSKVFRRSLPEAEFRTLEDEVARHGARALLAGEAVA